jgi:hypothetical protein
MDAGTILEPHTLPASTRTAGGRRWRLPKLFSPQNKRFTLLAMAVTFISIVTIASVTYLATHGGSTTITMLIGFAGPVVITQMIAMLRQEQSNDEARQRQAEATENARIHREQIEKEIIKTRHDIRGDLNATNLKMEEVVRKTNGGLTTAVKEVGEQVRQAERDQMITDPTHCRDFAKIVAEELEEIQKRKTPPGGQA